MWTNHYCTLHVLQLVTVPLVTFTSVTSHTKSMSCKNRPQLFMLKWANWPVSFIMILKVPRYSLSVYIDVGLVGSFQLHNDIESSKIFLQCLYLCQLWDVLGTRLCSCLLTMSWEETHGVSNLGKLHNHQKIIDNNKTVTRITGWFVGLIQVAMIGLISKPWPESFKWLKLIMRTITML